MRTAQPVAVLILLWDRHRLREGTAGMQRADTITTMLAVGKLSIKLI